MTRSAAQEGRAGAQEGRGRLQLGRHSQPDQLWDARIVTPFWSRVHSVNTTVDTHFSVFSLSLGAAPDCFLCSESLNRRNSSISSIRLSVCMEEEVLLSCSSPVSPSPSPGLLSC